MKKAVKIISVVIVVLIMAPIVIFNVQSIIISAMFQMPSEMKKESVCFLVPELTWNSIIKDIDSCLGEPVDKIEHSGDTGNELFTYNSSYENRPMTVDATVRAFTLTDIFHKRRVHRYDFDIECFDENDEKDVFEKLCNELNNCKASNELFSYTKERDNELSADINYGAANISYNIKYDIYDNQNKVYVIAEAMY